MAHAPPPSDPSIFLARLDLSLLQIQAQQLALAPSEPSSYSSTSSIASDGSIELGKYWFCVHGAEKCSTCRVDHRKENARIAGVVPVENRESLAVAFEFNEYGEAQCSMHKSKYCTCLGSGLRKQLIKANLASFTRWY